MRLCVGGGACLWVRVLARLWAYVCVRVKVRVWVCFCVCMCVCARACDREIQ